MNRLSGPRMTAPNLSASICQQLNMYAIAAGAAGVGILALAQPVEPKIVYTHAHVVIHNSHYKIGLNHDGIFDFVINQGRFFGHRSSFLFAVPYHVQGNGIEQVHSTSSPAAALKAGANIGHTKPFNHKGGLMADNKGQGYGYWNYAQARYLGVEFRINGKTHFGWARFKNSSAWGATLTGYAYETTPGKSIKAGQTKEAADQSGVAAEGVGTRRQLISRRHFGPYCKEAG
jgi:hypothetical protein